MASYYIREEGSTLASDKVVEPDSASAAAMLRWFPTFDSPARLLIVLDWILKMNIKSIVGVDQLVSTLGNHDLSSPSCC